MVEDCRRRLGGYRVSDAMMIMDEDSIFNHPSASRLRERLTTAIDASDQVPAEISKDENWLRLVVTFFFHVGVLKYFNAAQVATGRKKKGMNRRRLAMIR
jgi:hypothetical protein